MAQPQFELVIVSYHSRTLVEGLLKSLAPQQPFVLVDNAKGADDLAAVARAYPRGRYLEGAGAGYARAATLGARTSDYDYLVFVNPDCRPTNDNLRQLVSDVAADTRCASSSTMNIGDDGRAEMGVGGWEPSFPRTIVHSLGLHKIFRQAGLFAKPDIGEPIELDWVNGACMAVNRQRFLDLGGFDEHFYVYSEDVAYGATARANGMYQILHTDLPVPHSAGSSGAPSLEMLRLRGASFASYVRRGRHPGAARLLAAVMGAGYVLRSVVAAVRRHPGPSAEHLAYAKGVFSGRATVAGVEVLRGD